MTETLVKESRPPALANTCRCCGEPLKAAMATGCKHKSFAIQPQGWMGPLIFSAPTARKPGMGCGLTIAHGGTALNVGFNLELGDGRIVQNASGGLTIEQWDQLMGDLFLLAKEAEVELPWFRSLVGSSVGMRKRED